MAARPANMSLRSLRKALSSVSVQDPLVQCLAPALRRSMATEAAFSSSIASSASQSNLLTSQGLPRRQPPSPAPVLATVYRFPSLEPSQFVYYTADQLRLPLRRDILHKAVIYEADNTRQGTASTKTRGEVRGSGRKIRPQKGTGKARLGDKKSPMLIGGGRAHGPKPRDFSTDLPRKIYDLAWRTALSYRYKKGELLLLEDHIDIDEIGLAHPQQIDRILGELQLCRGHSGSMFVLGDEPNLVAAFSDLGAGGKMKTEHDVDVKDLLTKGKLLIQKSVLDRILEAHSSDLDRTAPKAAYYE